MPRSLGDEKGKIFFSSMFLKVPRGPDCWLTPMVGTDADPR